MNKKIYLRFLLQITFLTSLYASAQKDSMKLQIVPPFDSISINGVRAIGDPRTGSVEVSMQVRSDYQKLASIDFAGGAFGDFGVTDGKGTKYKYSSYDGPPGMSYGYNKGYSRIADLTFGQNKVRMVISVQDTLKTGQSETLKFRLTKVDTTVRIITEVHMLCTLMLQYMFEGQKELYIKNILVQWVKSNPKGRQGI